MPFQGDAQAECVVGRVFEDDFMSCMDNTVKELYENLKYYSTLTAANGQIRLNPGQKKKKEFIQWTRYHYHLGLDINLNLLPVTNIFEYIKKYKAQYGIYQ